MLFTTCAPPGIEPVTVLEHLETICHWARLVSPGAQLVELEVYVAWDHGPTTGYQQGVGAQPFQGRSGCPCE